MQRGQVVKLDRGYPLVRTDEGSFVRCEHATALVKGEEVRAVIGDFVEVTVPEGHDKGIIESILPRTRAFVRKDPTERALPQVLAAKFRPCVRGATAIRREREAARARAGAGLRDGAAVTVVLTKADLAESDAEVASVRDRVRALAGPDVQTVVVSADDPSSVEAVRALVPPNTTAVLIGKSGVGKSSLINMLVGHELQETTPVRDRDGKGRHTTVSREMVAIPGGGFIMDMPGVRGLGLWEADAGIGAAFADIEEAAERCRFRDCSHEDEPGCAVRAAVESAISANSATHRTRRFARRRKTCARAAKRLAACAAKKPPTGEKRPKRAGRARSAEVFAL